MGVDESERAHAANLEKVDYYDGGDVPVYDHLAEEFAVCDCWFSSVAGATLPNRLYALCGVAAGSRDDRPSHVPPLYHQPSFVRHLDAHHISWRWYPFDPGTLRLADAHYLLGYHHRFGYFSETGLPWKTIFDLTVNPRIASFLEDAADGTLRSVSWIDPAFTNFNPLGFPVNDDHPPADIKDGQDLVLVVYDALAASPQWDRSLLVIVYDEKGGFYDHVPPPQAACLGRTAAINSTWKGHKHGPIDANHPGGATGAGRRNPGRRSCPAARQAPDGRADRGEHSSAARCPGSGYPSGGYRAAEFG